MKRFTRILTVLIAVALCTSLFITEPIFAAPPSITSVSISPDPAYTDTDLVAIPEGWSDADDNPEGYQWQWQIWDEGTTAFINIEGATTDTLASTNFNVGDQLNVVCTPFDGVEAGTFLEATITISGGIVTITPDPAYTDTNLEAIPMHWPDEVDSYSYQWQIYDDVVPGFVPIGDDTNILASTNFNVGDEIKVLCTPSIASVPGVSLSREYVRV